MKRLPAIVPQEPAAARAGVLDWDLFCRVIDNYGDVGVCWRLAADLATRGDTVRLWVDDARALRWMAPTGAAGVTVLDWPGGQDGQCGGEEPGFRPSDVVVEAFGCDPPPGFVRAMAKRRPPPAWVNLEYLSAEPVVERLHRLPSPQAAGPGRGLEKWFFYPGFTAATGGLIREPDLAARQAAFDAPAWRRQHGIEIQAGERCLSLFCYPGAPVAGLLQRLIAGQGAPLRVLVAHGVDEASRKALARLQAAGGSLRVQALPPLSQRAYDELLWSCELNLVRGEDSFVRAQLAGRPFLWQIYPQHDAAHEVKLAAFLDRYLAGAGAGMRQALAAAFRAWNGAHVDQESGGSGGFPALPGLPGWDAHGHAWRRQLYALPDLTASLRDFALNAR